MALAEVWASRLAGDGERFRAAQARVLAAEKALGDIVPTVPESAALDHIPIDHLHGTVVPRDCIASMQSVFGTRYSYEKRADDSAMVFVVPSDLTRQEFEDGWARLMCHEVVLRTVIVEYDDTATAKLYKNYFVLAVTRAERDFRREIIIASKSPEPPVPLSDDELNAEVETAGDVVRRLVVALAEHTDDDVFTAYVKLSELAAMTFATRFAETHGIPTSDIRAFTKAFGEHMRTIATEDIPADAFLIGAGAWRMFDSYTPKQKAAMFLLVLMAFAIVGYIFSVLSASACGEIAKARDAATIAAGGTLKASGTPIWDMAAGAAQPLAMVGAWGGAAMSNMFGSGASAEQDQAWSLTNDLVTAFANRPSTCVGVQWAMHSTAITASSGLGLLTAAKNIAIALGIASLMDLVLMATTGGRQSTLVSVDPLAVPRVTRSGHGKDEEDPAEGDK